MERQNFYQLRKDYVLMKRRIILDRIEEYQADFDYAKKRMNNGHDYEMYKRLAMEAKIQLKIYLRALRDLKVDEY